LGLVLVRGPQVMDASVMIKRAADVPGSGGTNPCLCKACGLRAPRAARRTPRGTTPG